MRRTTRSTANSSRSEQGFALIAAIALCVLAIFIIGAIMIASRVSQSATRDRMDANATELLAKDAATALTEAFSSNAAGEFNGFVLTQPVLQAHASKYGGTVIPNAGSFAAIDSGRVPAAGRYTVRQDLEDGRVGYWQVYSIRVPSWGITPGARVQEYVRAWTTDATGSVVGQPSLYRVETRPQFFSDFEELIDGPIELGAGGKFNGRVHSNGFNMSFYDIYRGLVNAGQTIKFDPGSSCGPNARITATQGSIVGAPGSCAGKYATTSDVRINLLRGRQQAAALRSLCGGSHPSLAMVCSTSTNPITVTINGGSVSSSAGSCSATAIGDLPTNSAGCVIIAQSDVHIRGTLASNARLMIVTASPDDSSSYGTGSAPSIWVDGSAGAAANQPGSSFGAVAEGDVYLNEQSACPNVTLRGAVLAMSGLLSSHPTWRTPVYTPGGRTCASATIEGSIASHFGPVLQNTTNGSGYNKRTVSWLPSLYDNPPPMYPTSNDWETTKLELANADCFDGSGKLLTASTTCS